MSAVLESLNQKANTFFRGPVFSKVLIACGIDPRRYWLLMDLFARLSEREEMQGQLGRQSAALRFSAGLFSLIGSVGGLIMVAVGVPVRTFFGIYLGFTIFILVGILLSETANSLVNPVEGLVLAHQPIDGATYTGAKLSHLLRIVLYFAGGLNLIPGIAGAFLADSWWFYPLLHYAAILSAALILALACCAIFGWLMRIVPARRVKAAAQFVQGIPFVLIMTRRAWSDAALGAAAWVQNWFRWAPRWLLVFTAAGVVGVAIVSGLRTLSADYLIRVSTMVHSGAHARTKIRRSRLGEIVGRFFGGQPGRAGFDYLRKMMFRDWQFRRQLLSILPLLIFSLAGGAQAIFSNSPSPFARFTPAHLIPHAIGIILLIMCRLLQYGTDYKGVWLFLVVPDRALSRFAQGIHASLWLTCVVIPHVLLLGVFIWRWGVTDASLFVFYSAAASSIYLAVALRGIEGVPFGKQPNPSRAAGMQAPLFLALILIAVAVGIQYLLFLSRIVVELLIPFLWIAAYLLTRVCLNYFEVSIRHNLSLESGASKLVYSEVEAG